MVEIKQIQALVDDALSVKNAVVKHASANFSTEYARNDSEKVTGTRVDIQISIFQPAP